MLKPVYSNKLGLKLENKRTSKKMHLNPANPKKSDTKPNLLRECVGFLVVLSSLHHASKKTHDAV